MEKRQKILIVEDDAAIRDLIVLGFEQKIPAGWKIITAVDGMQAMEAVIDHQPVVMILDILLPRLNGLQLIEQLHEKGYLEHTQVIVVSGLGFKEVVHKMIGVGIRDFIVKPFDIDALVERGMKYVNDAVADQS
jgi:two-component system alkaline phosphatase synthesis response regulator PhoP